MNSVKNICNIEDKLFLLVIMRKQILVKYSVTVKTIFPLGLKKPKNPYGTQNILGMTVEYTLFITAYKKVTTFC